MFGGAVRCRFAPRLRDLMRHVAPLGWEHLSLTGDYAWDAEDQPAPGELPPLQSKPSLLAAQGTAFPLRSALAYADVTFLQ